VTENPGKLMKTCRENASECLDFQIFWGMYVGGSGT